MIWAFLGILFGVTVGLLFHVEVPLEYARYSAVVLLGLLDAVFGAIRAEIVDKSYDTVVFASGLLFNAILAIVTTYLGEKLGLNLYLAATVVFMFRIFQNVGVTRRVLLDQWIRAQKR